MMVARLAESTQDTMNCRLARQWISCTIAEGL
jgi:hypothetical protein